MSTAYLTESQLALPLVQSPARLWKPVATPKISRAWARNVALASCLTVIAAVSAYDTYWSFKNQDTLYDFEQNPVGRWLMELDGGDVALFMTVKMIGTLIVLNAIPLIGRFRKSWCLPIACSVATFQLLLFAYLNWGDLAFSIS